MKFSRMRIVRFKYTKRRTLEIPPIQSEYHPIWSHQIHVLHLWSRHFSLPVRESIRSLTWRSWLLKYPKTKCAVDSGE
jgi:hypothetical protein